MPIGPVLQQEHPILGTNRIRSPVFWHHSYTLARFLAPPRIRFFEISLYRKPLQRFFVAPPRIRAVRVFNCLFGPPPQIVVQGFFRTPLFPPEWLTVLGQCTQEIVQRTSDFRSRSKFLFNPEYSTKETFKTGTSIPRYLSKLVVKGDSFPWTIVVTSKTRSIDHLSLFSRLPAHDTIAAILVVRPMGEM